MSAIIDTQGFSCPQPMLMAKKAMEQQQSGSITVIADAEASRENITRAATQLGWVKSDEKDDNGVYTMSFTK